MGMPELEGFADCLVASRGSLLQQRADYGEVAPADLDERRQAQARHRAVQQLRQLGYAVTLTAKEDAA